MQASTPPKSERRVRGGACFVEEVEVEEGSLERLVGVEEPEGGREEAFAEEEEEGRILRLLLKLLLVEETGGAASRRVEGGGRYVKGAVPFPFPFPLERVEVDATPSAPGPGPAPVPDPSTSEVSARGEGTGAGLLSEIVLVRLYIPESCRLRRWIGWKRWGLAVGWDTGRVGSRRMYLICWCHDYPRRRGGGGGGVGVGAREGKERKLNFGSVQGKVELVLSLLFHPQSTLSQKW